MFPLLALAAYLVPPHHFDEYEAMTIAPRLAPLAVAGAIAALPASSTAGARRGADFALRLLNGSVIAGCAIYGVVLTREYRAFATESDDFRQTLAAIPAGGRLVGLVFDGESRVMDVESIERALPSLYVSLRRAPGSMVPLRYCGMRHVPCSLGPRAREIPPANPWAPEKFDPRLGGDFFDFAIVRSGPSSTALFAGRSVQTLGARGAWSAYGMYAPRGPSDAARVP